MRVVPDEITQIDLNWSHAAIDNEDFDDVEDDDASTRPFQINCVISTGTALIE